METSTRFIDNGPLDGIGPSGSVDIQGFSSQEPLFSVLKRSFSHPEIPF